MNGFSHSEDTKKKKKKKSHLRKKKLCKFCNNTSEEVFQTLEIPVFYQWHLVREINEGLHMPQRTYILRYRSSMVHPQYYAFLGQNSII